MGFVRRKSIRYQGTGSGSPGGTRPVSKGIPYHTRMKALRIRQLLLIAGILGFLGHTAAAETLLMLQPTYLSIGRAYRVSEGVLGVKLDAAYSTWGGTLTGFFGDEVGFLGSVGVYVPTYVTGRVLGFQADTELENGGIAATADLGVGWKIGDPLSPLAVLLGGTVHSDIVALHQPSGDSTEEDEDNPVTAVVGLSLQATPMYSISEMISINASLRVAYNFFEFLHEPEWPENLKENIDYAGAISWSLSIGAGIHL